MTAVKGKPAGIAQLYGSSAKLTFFSMEKILFIHDSSPRSRKALKLAASLAEKLDARLLPAHTQVGQRAGREKIVAGSNNVRAAASAVTRVQAAEPALTGELDISAVGTAELAQLVNQERVGLILCAAECRFPAGLNLDTLLSRIHCPLLLIPDNWSKRFERIVYLADLRYCRTDIVRYLAKLAAACAADLAVAHLTKEGLVHIEETYAHRLFEEQVRPQVKYDRLGFHYTRERDLAKAADVLTKGLHNELLVMTRNRYHFNELVGEAVSSRLPAHIQVPLLIFPG